MRVWWLHVLVLLLLGSQSQAATRLPCPDASVFRTMGQSSAVILTIRNHSPAPVDLYWVGSNGERRSFGTVAVDEEVEFDSQSGHLWLAEDEKGDCIAVFRVEAGTHDLGVIQPEPIDYRKDNTEAGRALELAALSVKCPVPLRKVASPVPGQADGRWTEVRQARLYWEGSGFSVYVRKQQVNASEWQQDGYPFLKVSENIFFPIESLSSVTRQGHILTFRCKGSAQCVTDEIVHNRGSEQCPRDEDCRGTGYQHRATVRLEAASVRFCDEATADDALVAFKVLIEKGGRQ